MENQGRSAEELVGRYLEALRRGRVVDALDVFATDAVVRDERGIEHRGIREIAASFVKLRRPKKVELVALDRAGDTTVAIVDIRGDENTAPERFRETFEVREGRVRTLTLEALGGGRPRATRKGVAPAQRRPMVSRA